MAETKNFDAMKEYADILRTDGDYEKALTIYKELAETNGNFDRVG